MEKYDNNLMIACEAISDLREALTEGQTHLYLTLEDLDNISLSELD